MAKRNLGEKIKLSTYDEMFGIDTFGHDDQKTEGQIINIPLSELHTFKDHPFRVLDDEKMEETVESIKAYGVLVPGLARPRTEGGYERYLGTVRVGISQFTSLEELDKLISALEELG